MSVDIEKAIKNDREFIASVIRQLPHMSADQKQVWIENPTRLSSTLAKALKQPFCHIVDLGKPPSLPFTGAEVVKHDSMGVVQIELRSDDDLYIAGKKIVLHLSERQMGDKQIVGNELREELEDGRQILLNSNVLDYLYDHPELFPEHWKQDENGETRYIFFWGSIFRNPSIGSLYVRYLYWSDGKLYRDYFWLGNDWNRQVPSASVAS